MNLFPSRALCASFLMSTVLAIAPAAQANNVIADGAAAPIASATPVSTAASPLDASVTDSSLVSWSAGVLSDVKSTTWLASCVPYLTALEQKVDGLAGAGSSAADLKAEAAAVNENLWQIRLALHDQLAGTSDACATEIRNTFRKLRYLEDALAEMNANIKPVAAESIDYETQPAPLLEDSPNYLTEKRDANFALQEGDIIVARGVSFLSAMIAQMGEVQSQFSHVIMVVKDPTTGLLETIESYVEDGVNFHELHWAMKNTNGRLLVLRAKDHDLALRAAQMMQKEVETRGEANRIHYDYALDFTDHTTMSCAEVAQYAYQVASNNQFNMPERPNNLVRGRDLLKNLNVKAGSTFTPGDLEGDSRFDLVAEYRDLRITRDMRERDAILSKIFTWMDEGSTLHDDFATKMAGGPIWSIRHTPFWPIVRKMLHVADFSAEIPRAMVATVNLVTELGNGEMKELLEEDNATETQSGVYQNYSELNASLEAMKSADEILYANQKTRSHSIILKYLRAN
jgi:hypothetical protein